MVSTAVLNRRLHNWIETNQILAEEQAGFRRERSTTDQIFILTEIVVARRPKKTFVAFIDIAKAYDRVWRNGLWHKLLQSGIRGKMWRILKNIYNQVESSVLLGQGLTDFFTIEVGLRQGCLLSPILFDLLLNDLVKELNSLKKGVKVGHHKISILLFADDIALIADSKEDLELLLKTTYEFSLKWRFKFNYDKCATIEFDNISHEPFVYGDCKEYCTCGHHYRFGKNLIQQVLVYKYLGTELDNCLTFTQLRTRLASKARTNIGRIWAMGLRSGFLSVKAAINLWKALGLSTLQYSCAIWGNVAWKEGEQIQLTMARRILRCSTMTTKEALRGELGWWTLRAQFDLVRLCYWFHILSLPDSRLLKQSYLYSKSFHRGKKKNWANTTKKILVKYHTDDNKLLDLWYHEDRVWNIDGKGNGEAKSITAHKRFFKNYIFKIIQAREESLWREKMFKERKAPNQSKLRIYRIFKTKLRLEKYLSASTNYEGRVLLTNLRSGTNKLEIERGRWKNLKEELRVCTHCNLRHVENEYHFLVLCSKYEALRQSLFQKISDISADKWNLNNLGLHTQFLLLINGTGDSHEMQVFSAVQSFIYRAFKLRGD